MGTRRGTKEVVVRILHGNRRKTGRMMGYRVKCLDFDFFEKMENTGNFSFYLLFRPRLVLKLVKSANKNSASGKTKD